DFHVTGVQTCDLPSSNKKLVVLSSVKDAQALLNNTSVFITAHPTSGEFAAGDFYLLTEDWQSLSWQSHRQSYIWGDHVFNDMERDRKSTRLNSSHVKI